MDVCLPDMVLGADGSAEPVHQCCCCAVHVIHLLLPTVAAAAAATIASAATATGVHIHGHLHKCTQPSWRHGAESLHQQADGTHRSRAAAGSVLLVVWQL